MGMQLLEAGKVVNTHGVRGEVRIQPWADTPAFLAGLRFVYIDGARTEIVSARVHKGFVIASLGGVSDIDSAIKLKNKTVCVSRDDVRLEEGLHFIADLIGLRAIDEKTGEVFGAVADVMTLPANNVYVIKGEREVLIPAVPDFIAETDIAGGYIRFRLIEGM